MSLQLPQPAGQELLELGAFGGTEHRDESGLVSHVLGESLINDSQASVGEADDTSAPISVVVAADHEAGCLEPVQPPDWRWLAVTAVAPVAWGSTYFVTRHFLPTDAPLWGSAIRALPAGIALLLLARQLPKGSWWWRAAVLGLLNFGGFYPLVYLSALLLPSSVASSIMALAPVVLAGFGWAILSERPGVWMAAGAVIGILGVLLIVGTGASTSDPWGVLASASALVMSSVGAVLNKKWSACIPVLASTAWQTVAAGLMLLAAALVFEGSPPVIGPVEIAGFAYISLVATALASVCWFAGMARLPAGTVGIVGLLNPVTGILLGTLAAHEDLSWFQAGGIALVLVAIAIGRRRPGVGAVLVV
jgi:probable blue pigment (indigoidine) exporter